MKETTAHPGGVRRACYTPNWCSCMTVWLAQQRAGRVHTFLYTAGTWPPPGRLGDEPPRGVDTDFVLDLLDHDRGPAVLGRGLLGGWGEVAGAC
mgnify:CR=1 FL=1